jgi:hypothetical protein
VRNLLFPDATTTKDAPSFANFAKGGIPLLYAREL